MLRAAGVALVASVAALATPPEPAWACTCMPLELSAALDGADAAFVGVPVSRVVDGPPRSSADPAYWSFEVERSVKGDLPRRLVVETAADGASCGLELTLGMRTGLLVERRGDRYASGLCWQLGADALASAAGGRRWWPWALAAGLALAASAGSAVALARRRG